MTADAAALLDSWAARTGRAPSVQPVLPDDGARPDVIYRVQPEVLCIPGYDDRQEGDPDRNGLELDDAMTLSIMAVGVLEPIIVQRNNNVYEVIAGRRRTRHAREANRRLGLDGEAPLSVPVLVKGSRLSPEMAFIVDTTLNVHRLNDSISVKMRKAAKMLVRNIDIRTVAIAFRVDPSRIETWVRITKEAHPCVHAALDAGQLAVTTAADLARLPVEEQPPALKKLLEVPMGRAAAVTAVRAIRRREPVPGRVPRRAVRWVLDGAEQFDPEFLRGIRFVRGELSEVEVREILAKVGR